jgi:hypothetical protein
MRIAQGVALFLVALLGTATAAPQLLAWPYSAEIGHTRIYSESPIPPEMRAVLARSDALVARSPFADPGLERRLFLTDGGWRWDLLALTSRGAFALRRPLRDAIVVNASNVAADRVENGAPVGGARSLSGVIAHETTHLIVAHRLGEWRAFMLPGWKSEGYADYVARESSLGDADYARLRANGARRDAMFYYEARRRVAEALRRNGGNVDALLEGQ